LEHKNIPSLLKFIDLFSHKTYKKSIPSRITIFSNSFHPFLTFSPRHAGKNGLLYLFFVYLGKNKKTGCIFTENDVK